MTADRGVRDRATLRALCRDTLRGLGLRPPLDVHELVDRLGHQRRKPIILLPYYLDPRHTSGLTGGDQTGDVIMFQARAAPTHRRLIILHELAHIIAAHPRRPVDHSYPAWAPGEDRDDFDLAVLADLLGDTPAPQTRPDAWKRRTLYDNPIEWEAETMATIMLGWIPECGGRACAPPPDPFEAILGGPPTW